MSQWNIPRFECLIVFFFTALPKAQNSADLRLVYSMLDLGFFKSILIELTNVQILVIVLTILANYFFIENKIAKNPTLVLNWKVLEGR